MTDSQVDGQMTSVSAGQTNITSASVIRRSNDALHTNISGAMKGGKIKVLKVIRFFQNKENPESWRRL